MEKKSNITWWILATILIFTFLMIFEEAEVSWVIVILGIIHGLRLVYKYSRIWWRKRYSKVARRERFLLFLASWMILFLATGTALFLWAFCAEYGDNPKREDVFLFVNAEFLLRSLICSLQLFTASIDSNVMDSIHEHLYIKGLISIQAVLSFACTIAILISLAFTRVKAFLKLHRQTKVDKDHNHLYVFFGMNEPSRLLAKSIRDKEQERALIVFVENSRVDDDVQSGWDTIVGMFTHRRQIFMDADEVNARVTFSETRLCDVELEKTDMTDIFGEMNLLKLKELIQQLSLVAEAKLHIFFLSENEDENIRAMSIMAMDTTIHQVNDIINPRFYCHARQNGLNRVIEDIAVKRNLEVRIIDSSHLAIELLKADENNHPVMLIDIDEENPTTVRSEFNALVVGFDEAGQDALKFLYEFGAFVDSTASPNNEFRSPFHCIATDKRMSELQSLFTTFSPAAMAKKNKDGSNLIELKQCDCKSSLFYDGIVKLDIRQKLNYVVIAVGDDELGMTLAIRLLNHIRRDREDLSKLRIYVRSYRLDKELYMQKIANFYNEGYNKDSKDKYQTDAIIIPFGQMEKIYSFDMIINEELTEKGKRFHEGYAKLRGENPAWNERRVKDLKKASINSLRSLRRKESQDMANALHMGTKIYLLQHSLPETFNWQDFLKRYYNEKNQPQCEGEYDHIWYPFLSDQENMAVLNLARLEHLRWIASHEMLGYTKAGNNVHGCNERTRQHNCLRPWQELDDESMAVAEAEGWKCDYKSYDYSVVDISIFLNKDKFFL